MCSQLDSRNILDNLDCLQPNARKTAHHRRSHQACKKVTIQGHPLVTHLEHISTFINQTSQKYGSTQPPIRSDTFGSISKLKKSLSEGQDKENRRCENIGEKGEKYKLNMMMIAREGSQSFIKASQKIKQFQIMEFSMVVDQCLEFVADNSFFK